MRCGSGAPVASSQPPRLAQAEPVPGSSIDRAVLREEEPRDDRPLAGSGRPPGRGAKTYAIARWPVRPCASSRSARGAARRTASADASGITSCSDPGVDPQRRRRRVGRDVGLGEPEHRGELGARRRRRRDAAAHWPAASRRRRAPSTGMTPALISSVTASPGLRQRANDVRGAERRMAGERHLERRREDAHARRRASRRQDERRLRQVELQRERLHRRVVDAARVLEHAQRIAAERRLGEHVDDAEGVGRHGSAPQAAGREPALTPARRARARAPGTPRRSSADGATSRASRDARESSCRSTARTSDRSAARAARRRACPSRRPPPRRSSARSSSCRAAGTRRASRARQRAVVGEEVRVLVLQQLDPQRLRQCRGGCTSAARIAASSASGTCTVPIFLLSDST